MARTKKVVDGDQAAPPAPDWLKDVRATVDKVMPDAHHHEEPVEVVAEEVVPAPEVVPEAPERFAEARQEVLDGNSKDAATIEFYGDDLRDMFDLVARRAKELGEGGVLYLTFKRALVAQYPEAREALKSTLKEYFTTVQTLNIGTSPYIKDRNFDTRTGFVCIRGCDGDK